MLVYFAVVLTALMGFCGLAIDVGRMELRTNQMQAAADAGALAGAGELAHGGSGSNWQTAAQNDVIALATANGLPLTGSMTATLGADYGPYLGDYSTVEVTLTQPLPTIFLGLLTKANASLTLSVKAVAQMPPCMFFLSSPDVRPGIAFWNASAGFDAATGCPIYSRTGVGVDGFAHMAGSQIRSSAPAGASQISGYDSYTPMYNVPGLADPLAYLPMPTAAGCDHTNESHVNLAAGTTVSLTPGVYCGSTSASLNYTPSPGANCGMQATRTTPGLDVGGVAVAAGQTGVGCPWQGINGGTAGNCSTRPTVNLAPGRYTFIGGANFSCVNVVGSGVTLFFTSNSSVGFGQMRMTSTNWNVSAPNDTSQGGIAGVVVLNDRSWTGSTQDFQWNYSTWYGDGVVYLTGTGVNAYDLSMSAPNYINLVVPNMYNYLGEIRPATNYSNVLGGNPLHTVVSLVQ